MNGFHVCVYVRMKSDLHLYIVRAYVTLILL